MLEFMRYVVAVLWLASFVFAVDPPSCLIIRHASTSRQIFVSGANWQYVEGDFPPADLEDARKQCKEMK